MQENTNKILVYNSLILYVRLVITVVASLLTTRFALQALGVVDFGLYAVVGGVVTFIAIINTTMVSASNRFMAVAIGRGDERDMNEVFNVNVVIQACIACIVLLVALPLGRWYILHYVNYDGNISIAVTVFVISIISSSISFLGVPYHGLLLAKERFLIFCCTDILSSLIKLGACYLLLYYWENKLLAYAIIMAIITIYPSVFFWGYCTKRFANIVRLKFVQSKYRYKEVLKFSIWVGYGALAQVGQTQLATLLVNNFFNTVMNTALSIANYVKSMLLLFSQNISKPISPQITKSYAAGNEQRCYNLMILSSKLSFLVVLIVSSPILIEPEFVLGLWLGEIPPYVISFTKLVVINSLVDALNMGVAEYVFARGNIKWYQLCVNTLYMISIVVAYVVLKHGAPATALLYTYIIFSIVILIVRQLILYISYKFNNWILIKRSILPAIMVAIMLVIYTLLPIKLHPILNILTMTLYLCGMIWLLGLSRQERKAILGLIQKNTSNT